MDPIPVVAFEPEGVQKVDGLGITSNMIAQTEFLTRMNPTVCRFFRTFTRETPEIYDKLTYNSR